MRAAEKGGNPGGGGTWREREDKEEGGQADMPETEPTSGGGVGEGNLGEERGADQEKAGEEGTEGARTVETGEM